MASIDELSIDRGAKMSERVERFLKKIEEKINNIFDDKTLANYLSRNLLIQIKTVMQDLMAVPLEKLDIILKYVGEIYKISISGIQELRQEFTKISSLLDSFQRSIDKKLDEILEILREKRTVESFQKISWLWFSRATLSSRYDIPFNESLYVHRATEERIFDNFILGLSMNRPKNLFAIVSHAGLGKTWLMAYLAKRLLKANEIVIFIKARFGFEEQMEEFFGVPFFKINNILDEIVDQGKSVFIFIDGLDEARQDVVTRIIFFILSQKNKPNVGIVLSCRYSDWLHRKSIQAYIDQIKDMIFVLEEHEIPASVILKEFTSGEVLQAIEKYGIANLEESSPLYSLAKKPFILKIITDLYIMHGRLPDVGEKEFIDRILDRLGLRQEPSTWEAFKIVVEKIAESSDWLVPFEWLMKNFSDRVISNIIGSGIITVVFIHDSYYITIEKSLLEPLINHLARDVLLIRKLRSLPPTDAIKEYIRIKKVTSKKEILRFGYNERIISKLLKNMAETRDIILTHKKIYSAEYIREEAKKISKKLENRAKVNIAHINDDIRPYICEESQVIIVGDTAYSPYLTNLDKEITPTIIRELEKKGACFVGNLAKDFLDKLTHDRGIIISNSGHYVYSFDHFGNAYVKARELGDKSQLLEIARKIRIDISDLKNPAEDLKGNPLYLNALLKLASIKKAEGDYDNYYLILHQALLVAPESNFLADIIEKEFNIRYLKLDPSHFSAVNDVKIINDRFVVYITNVEFDGSVRVYDIKEGRIIRKFDHKPKDIILCDPNPEGYLAVLCEFSIHVYNIYSGEKIQTYNKDYIAYNLSWIDNHKFAVIASDNIYVYDINRSEPIDVIEIQRPICFGLVEDKYLVFSGDWILFLIDKKDKSIYRQRSMGSLILDWKYDHGSKTILLLCTDKIIRLNLDLDIVEEIPLPREGYFGSLSNDYRTAIFCGREKGVWIYDIITKEIIYKNDDVATKVICIDTNKFAYGDPKNKKLIIGKLERLYEENLLRSEVIDYYFKLLLKPKIQPINENVAVIVDGIGIRCHDFARDVGKLYDVFICHNFNINVNKKIAVLYSTSGLYLLISIPKGEKIRFFTPLDIDGLDQILDTSSVALDYELLPIDKDLLVMISRETIHTINLRENVVNPIDVHFDAYYYDTYNNCLYIYGHNKIYRIDPYSGGAEEVMDLGDIFFDVERFVIDPDRGVAYIVTIENQLYIYNNRLKSLDYIANDVNSVSYCPISGKLLYRSGDKLYVHDGKEINNIGEYKGVNSIAIFNNAIFISTKDNVQRIAIDTLSKPKIIPSRLGGIYAVSTSSKYLFAGSGQGYLLVFELPSMLPKSYILFDHSVLATYYDEDTQKILSSGVKRAKDYNVARVEIVSTKDFSRKTIEMKTSKERGYLCEIAKLGNNYYCVDEALGIYRIDVSEKRLVKIYDSNYGIRRIPSVSDKLIFHCFLDHKIMSIENGKVIDLIELSRPIYYADLHDDLLAVISRNREIEIFKIKEGKPEEMTKIRLRKSLPKLISWIDKDKIAVITEDKRLLVIDVHSGSILNEKKLELDSAVRLHVFNDKIIVSGLMEYFCAFNVKCRVDVGYEIEPSTYGFIYGSPTTEDAAIVISLDGKMFKYSCSQQTLMETKWNFSLDDLSRYNRYLDMRQTCFSLAGDKLMLFDERNIHIYDENGNEIYARSFDEDILDAVFNGETKIVFTTLNGVHLLDLDTNSVETLFETPKPFIVQINQKLVAIVSMESNMVFLYDSDTSKIYKIDSPYGVPLFVNAFHDKRFFLQLWSDRIVIYELIEENYVKVGTIESDENLLSAVWSEDGDLVVFTENGIEVLETISETIWLPPGLGMPRGLNSASALNYYAEEHSSLNMMPKYRFDKIYTCFWYPLCVKSRYILILTANGGIFKWIFKQ